MPAPPISPLLVRPERPAIEPAGPIASQPASPWMLAVQRSGAWITLVLVAVAFAPLLMEHLLALTFSNDFQHAPLVLAAMLALLWQRWPARDEPRDEQQRPPLGLLIGLLGLALAIVLHSPPLAMLSAVPAVMAGVRIVARVDDRNRLWAPCLLLLALVPLPYILHSEVVNTLKGWTTNASSLVLDLIGIDHAAMGFTLLLPGKSFFVDDACSGVNSLYGMAGLCLVLAVWWRLPVLLTFASLAATTGAVVVVNILRVLIIVAGYSWQGIDLSRGTPHYLLGIALLPLTLGLVVGVVSWVQWLLAPIAEHGDSLISLWWDRMFHGDHAHPEDDDATVEDDLSSSLLGVVLPEAQAVTFASFAFVWAPIAVLAVLAVGVQGGLAAAALGGGSEPDATLPLTAEFLPDSFQEWERVDFQSSDRAGGDPQGRHSRTWVYRSTQSGLLLTVSIDESFVGWHDLLACYRAVGWVVTERQTRGGAGKPHFVEAELQKSDGDTAYLRFALTDALQKTLEPPRQNWQGTLRNQMRIAGQRFGRNSATRQTQLLVQSGRKLSAAETEALDRMFLEAIRRLGAASSSSGEPGP